MSSNQRPPTVRDPERRALGFAGVAKHLTFYRIEPVGGRKKPVALAIPHDNSRGLRTDFDDVSVWHLQSVTLSAADNNAGEQ